MPKAADFSAIYGIRHIANGRIYVGSAVRTNARWRHHRSQLQRGTHHSRYLQAAWNKYGADNGTSPMAGIETPATTDNLQGEIA